MRGMAIQDTEAMEVAARLHKRRKTHDGIQAVPDPAAEAAALREQVVALESALAAKDRRIDAMKDIGRTLGSVLALDDVLKLILGYVTELLEADRSTLYLVDPKTKELWSKIAQGDNVEEIRLPMGVGLAGWVAKSGEPLNLRDVYNDKRFNAAVDRRTGYRTQDMVAYPMRDHRGGILGVVQALNKKGSGGFTEEDQRTLEAISCQAAAAIENAVLYREAVTRADELALTRDQLAHKLAEVDLLFEFSQAMARARDEQEIVLLALARASALVGAEGAVMLRLLGPTAQMSILSQTDRQNSVRHMPGDPHEGLLGWVASRAQPVLVEDVQNDPRHSRSLARTLDIVPRQMCGVPMIASDGSCIGALTLVNRPGGFSEEHVVLLTMLGNHVAKTLEAAAAREQDQNARRLQTIGSMLSGVVHDFKTPMTIISGYVQLMTGSQDSNERKEYAELVLKQFDNVNQMTRDLLQFARGEVEVLLRKVFVSEFVAEVEEMLTQVLLGSPVTFEVETRFRGSVRMDPTKMLRVVSNVARNAKEAMPQGGKFTFSVEQRGESVVLVMADNGPGIPEELAGRLFQEFATHGKSGGTGLGLAVVKRIVHEHRGDVTWETARGKGTTFTVRLPL